MISLGSFTWQCDRLVHMLIPHSPGLVSAVYLGGGKRE
jgi:hypothetical protein